MKLTLLKSTVLALVVLSPMSVMAEEPLQKPAAYGNPILAIAQIPIAGVRIATGAVAIPLMIVGEIGNVSGQVGESLWQEANRQRTEPKKTVSSNISTNHKEKFL
jgi:hypothetical protein